MGATIAAKLRAFSDTASLGTDAPPLLFLDANILLAAHNHERAMSGTGGRRSQPLADFLRAAANAGAKLFSTPAAMEEAFHIVCGRLLRAERRKHSCLDDKELRIKHWDDYAAARTAGFVAFQEMVKAIGKFGVSIRIPIPSAADDPKKVGRKVLEAFSALVGAVPAIGGKDALHIVTAEKLDCRWFVSNDGDFRFVPGIDVFCENPGSVVR